MKGQIQGCSLRAALITCAALVCLSNLAIAQAGQLDSTFGTAGVFSTNDGQQNTDLADCVALQTDGKIVVGGQITFLAGVLRLNSNGTLDSSFGTGGKTIIHLPNGDQGGGEQVIGVSVQPGGQIVTAISTENFDGETVFVLARLTPSGVVDPTFGSGGFVITQPFNGAGTLTAFAQQPDGKLLLAGDPAIARYSADGQLDPTFGTNGVAPLLTRSVTAIALQPNGEILLASGGPPPGGPSPATITDHPSAGSVTRYKSNGSLDTGFGIAGQVTSVVAASAIAVQNGNILVAGPIVSQLVDGGPGNQTGFGIVRYRSSGSIDTTFGKHGAVITGFPASGGEVAMSSLVLQTNGDILAAGLAGAVDSASSFALARYSNAGVLDPIFGSGGQVTTSLGSSAGIAALILQPDGKIVVAGNFFSGSVNNIAVARYLAQ